MKDERSHKINKNTQRIRDIKTQRDITLQWTDRFNFVDINYPQIDS